MILSHIRLIILVIQVVLVVLIVLVIVEGRFLIILGIVVVVTERKLLVTGMHWLLHTMLVEVSGEAVPSLLLRYIDVGWVEVAFLGHV